MIILVKTTLLKHIELRGFIDRQSMFVTQYKNTHLVLNVNLWGIIFIVFPSSLKQEENDMKVKKKTVKLLTVKTILFLWLLDAETNWEMH